MIVEHVDFWAVPVTDMERAKAFYGETLGLEQTGDVGFPEFKLGDNGFLYLLQLEAKGLDVGEMWDNGICNGAGVSDPAGNRILLHHRYKAYDEV